MASMFEEVAADDAAMSEIRAVVASNPVVTVELAAINIALTVVKVTSIPQIAAIATDVAVPALLIVERAALRPLCEVRASWWATRYIRRARRAARHHPSARTTAAHTATATAAHVSAHTATATAAHVGAHTAATTAAAPTTTTTTTAVMTLRVSASREDER
jgi:hypothetical protein